MKSLDLTGGGRDLLVLQQSIQAFPVPLLNLPPAHLERPASFFGLSPALQVQWANFRLHLGSCQGCKPTVMEKPGHV